MKYRWLDDERLVLCRGRSSTVDGHMGRIVVLPRPGCVGNVLVDFGGLLVVCPAGTLRRACGKYAGGGE
jgi:hypothetical protein